ncbi:MAG: radical SAM protein [Planctomycetes bacterium]|nr:radical SAM protein [Planctomycetota bacterium]
MKVLLLFPPDWLPSEPYLSLPTLTAVLRKAGCEVIQKDVNVEMYDMMLSKRFLLHVRDRIAHALPLYRRLAESQPHHTGYKQLVNHIRTCNDEFFARVGDDVEKAIKIIRSKDFYDINKLEWANARLHDAMSVISLGYYPAQICFPPMETDLGYKTYQSSEILNAIEDDAVNIYRHVYRQLVEPVIEREQPAMIGISVVQKKQLIPTFTFCRMIKEKHPDIHITLGGNIITRMRDILPRNTALFRWFDTAILYEGEDAILQVAGAIDNHENDFSRLPNLIYKDKHGIHTNTTVTSVDITRLPPPDFDGLPLNKYFVPRLILPYLATRGCYWGRCAFCDHSQGYTRKYRAKPVEQIIDEIESLKNNHGCRHFHFTDESYPPALFKRLSQKLIEKKTGISWTTHLRFEKSLMDETVWKEAAESGCKSLYFGYESGSERVLELMNKATNLETIKTILRHSARHGIWNHCMGFFGFPGETREEAEDSIRFLDENKDFVHSVGFMTFVLGKYSPIAREPDRYGVSAYKNPEWDLALDYYFTTKSGLGVHDALKVFEEFERHHDPKWDLRLTVREYIFLYVDHFQTNHLNITNGYR